MKKISKVLFIFLTFSLIFGLASCGNNIESDDNIGPSTNNLNTNQEQNVNKEIIRISTFSLEDPQKMKEKYQPLCDYLEEKVGQEFEFVPQPNFEQVVQEMKKKTIDIADLGSAQYVNVNSFGSELLVRSLENGKETFEYVIFTRSDSEFEKIDDVKGNRLVVFNTFPSLRLLNENSISRNDLAELKLLDTQNDVIMSVLSKDYEFGTVKKNIFNKYVDKGLKVIAEGKLPTLAMVSRPKFDNALKNKIKTALLELKDEKILKSLSPTYTGFEEAKDADYSGVREDMRKLGLID